MESEAIVVQPERELIQSATPMDLLRVAVSQNFDLDKLDRLMAMQERHLAAEAKRAFDEAKAKFSGLAVHVSKDKTNKQYDSKYTSIGNLVNTVTPYLGQCDLSAKWEIDQTQGIKVTCVLRHKMGHQEVAVMVVPPDASGQKNPIQQIKSAITYARVCTFEMVCGLASTDGTVNVDDDGNGAHVTMGDVAERVEWMANARNEAELKKLYAEAANLALEAADKKAMIALRDARDKRLKELQCR